MELNIKDKITFLREKYGYTQETVSKMLNIKRATYAKYENGQAKNLPNKIIYQLAKIYNVSADYFFSLDTDKPVKSYRFSDASELITRDELKFISVIRLVPKDKRDEVFDLILKFADNAQTDHEPLKRDTDEE